MNRQRLVGGKALDFYLHGDERLVCGLVQLNGVKVYTLNRRAAFTAQLDGTPDADRGQARAPVPPKSELSLAHENALRVVSPELKSARRIHMIAGAIKAQCQCVGPSGAKPPSHVKDRLAEHV